jgi:DNA-binding MarR family transcriptional regulator
MDAAKVNKLLRPLDVAVKATGHDLTVRQLLILLHIAKAGAAGTDQRTIETATGIGQSSVSRSLKLFAVELGLIEFFLDAQDGRLRLVALSDKGKTLTKTMLNGL